MMKLSGGEKRQLWKALLDAYRTYDELKIMVEFQLDETLEVIVKIGNLRTVVFDLIQWAESRGRLEQLIIGSYADNSENPILKEFYKTVFKIRFIDVPIVTTKDFGPEINWLGPTENIQLQSFFQPQPNWYDVGFLKQAIEQTKSVCRIEIPTQGIKATGVLIANQFVLSNYHVFDPDRTGNIQTNALKAAILSFGRFSSQGIGETEGQSFKLDPINPIIESSLTSKLDYVLLKVENSIIQAQDIKPANWKNSFFLAPKMGINILQHPEGNSMKLSISTDGITAIDSENGKVQYINQAAEGSSGSPCFDDHWNLIALHHAERTIYAGSIKRREGILFGSIFSEIKSYLD